MGFLNYVWNVFVIACTAAVLCEVMYLLVERPLVRHVREQLHLLRQIAATLASIDERIPEKRGDPHDNTRNDA